MIVNGRRQPLTIITKRSILDVAAALDPPLYSTLSSRYKIEGQQQYQKKNPCLGN